MYLVQKQRWQVLVPCRCKKWLRFLTSLLVLPRAKSLFNRGTTKKSNVSTRNISAIQHILVVVTNNNGPCYSACCQPCALDAATTRRNILLLFLLLVASLAHSCDGFLHCTWPKWNPIPQVDTFLSLLIIIPHSAAVMVMQVQGRYIPSIALDIWIQSRSRRAKQTLSFSWDWQCHGECKKCWIHCQ